MIVQAKSGTGKTLVFGVICLESINTEIDDLQALILSPTREIAVQTQQLLKQIGANVKGKFFIGISIFSILLNKFVCIIWNNSMSFGSFMKISSFEADTTNFAYCVS